MAFQAIAMNGWGTDTPGNKPPFLNEELSVQNRTAAATGY
jgi:hypothetical protein